MKETVSRSKAFRMARDAYLHGEEVATSRSANGQERPSYEDRVRAAEDTARILMEAVSERRDPTPQEGGPSDADS